ncbi:DUF2515 family protein [Xenorhabdus bovienii]|uniref:Uncharacterized protein n=1 Tax=Xenorhabdus bovienii str. Intermedium TaxID=1379677 RepID=A0A077QPI1_XENBV|nr:hypothetical protein [Xenorhabdus bovienii]MDE1484474.1 hypothetical protein [Xenorhabdus bovienii]MDE9432813.1 hypothetical protein [Xenorhabdus bovienii]MDE9443668.1 hypothetical protein [Xenorhabdus bovienii]MDE9463269.1 hypothetical protein [Xenorhabdus bovienii]MDE9471062.1 hypothetical protein [Xenorhabdus bovienii]
MIEVLKKHKYDDLALHQSTQSVAACDCHFEEKDGKQIKVIDVPILTCECVWRRYQKEAEDIVAPGGVLIADPKERNKRINAAYASLWLNDNRFQWAGLAAFASKQVGCGLLHAYDTVEKVRADREAQKRVIERIIEVDTSWQSNWPVYPQLMSESESANIAEAMEKHRQTSDNNPLSAATAIPDAGLTQASFNYVYEMMALGNTTLFLDVYPLHAFYKQRGLEELKTCIKKRENIYGNSQYPILWPIGQEKLDFGQNYPDIMLAFEAIEAGDIAQGVVHLANHEQINILQPTMYSDTLLVLLLRGNQISFVTGFPSGVAESVELTLASQCRRVDDGRTIEFSDEALADLSDIKQRMPFVYKAATRFDEMLRDSNRSLLEESLQNIAAGRGVQ